MMAALALSSVGVEATASLSHSESVVEAKARKKHHKRRAVRRRKNSKRHKKAKNKEYYSKGRFMSNGLEISQPQRIDYYNARTNSYSPVVVVKVTNKSKRTFTDDLSSFVYKHTRVYGSDISHNNKKVEIPLDGIVEAPFRWTKSEMKELNNTSKLKPKKSAKVMLGTVWSKTQWQNFNIWELRYLNNKGKVIKTVGLPVNVKNR